MRATWGKDGRAPSCCAVLHQTNNSNPKSLYQQSDHQQQATAPAATAGTTLGLCLLLSTNQVIDSAYFSLSY